MRTLGRLAEAEKLGALVELLRDHRAADGVEEGHGGAGRDDSDDFFMIVLGLVGTSGAGGDLIPG